MGSLEAGMQLVYERVSCNITLHRDLSGPSQRAIVFPPPSPPHSPCFPGQASVFQLPFPSEWERHGGYWNPEHGDWTLSLTVHPPKKVCWNPGKTVTLGMFPSFSHFLPLLWTSLERGLRFKDGISRPRERINICGEVEVKQWCRERREGITRSSSR